jgi:hypothetical protein
MVRPRRYALSFRDGPKNQARNLEIPGSMLAHRPGMTLFSEDVIVSTASSDAIRFRSRRIARHAGLCSIAAPPPAPAGFKPEFA